jgi:pyruvate kinase
MWSWALNSAWTSSPSPSRAKLRSILDRARPRPLIVAKIEDQEALRNLDAIVREADAIMVARGDLGIEAPYEELPMIQRHIVETCLRVGRPVIVATHMLESMIENPMPTRAEITDVANAVFEQADAIMLSGETTTGKYPVQCVEVFDRIARRVERDAPPLQRDDSLITSARQSMVKSAVILADEICADGIIILTIRGHVPRHAAWMRPRHSPIFAVCENWAVADSLALHFAVTPLVTKFHHAEPERTVQNALQILRERKLLAPGGTVVVISSVSAADTMVDAVQLRTV